MSPPQVCKIVTFPRVPQRISGNKDRSGFQQENSFLSAGFFINVQIASNAHSFPQHGTWREAERRKKGYVAQREKKKSEMPKRFIFPSCRSQKSPT